MPGSVTRSKISQFPTPQFGPWNSTVLQQSGLSLHDVGINQQLLRTHDEKSLFMLGVWESKDAILAAGVPPSVFDEIYQLKNYEKAKVRELLVLDRLMLTADDIKAKKATPGDYPVAWGKKFGSGKVFYTSLGHREDVWDPTVTEKGQRANDGSVAKAFQQHVLGGILWSLGLAAGDATPQAK